MDSSNKEIKIIITNVVVTFRTMCQLNLRTVASKGKNVIHKPEMGKVVMRLREPGVTATIRTSGKIICTGAISEEEAKVGARRIARRLQKLGFNVTFSDFKVVNVLAVCYIPFGIKLADFTNKNRPIASYEPELHPGANYRIKDLKASLQVFSNGTLSVAGPSVQNVRRAVEQVYPLLLVCHRPSSH